MSTDRRSGFTIIEVMLFLAITGALAVGILASSGFAIDQQRYRDSVNSLKGLIQSQYSQITNVINEEAKNPGCSLSLSSSELVVDESEDKMKFRGTSDCLVLGRFLLVESTKVTTYDVIGEPSTNAAEKTSDSEMLREYGMAARSPETYDISWGARVVTPRTNNDATASVLIVRSPLSGAILTYTQDGNSKSNLQSMLSDNNMKQKDFCVDPSGMVIPGSRLAVRIGARAANQSAVEIPVQIDDLGNETKVCD